jgi:ribonuclease HII
MNPMIYEKALWKNGVKRIACCDEVGRGCLFGPVVAAAVILKPFEIIEGVKDSKKLSEKKRELYYAQILEKAVAVGVGVVSVEEIERVNIKQASRQAMILAINRLKTADGQIMVPEALLIDAEILDLPYPQQAVIHGEDQVHGIAAASIVAKVTRDRMCQEWHRTYPQYGFDKHKGYGTKIHREALLTHGPTPLHRKSFIQKIMASNRCLT